MLKRLCELLAETNWCLHTQLPRMLKRPKFTHPPSNCNICLRNYVRLHIEEISPVTYQDYRELIELGGYFPFRPTAPIINSHKVPFQITQMFPWYESKGKAFEFVGEMEARASNHSVFIVLLWALYHFRFASRTKHYMAVKTTQIEIWLALYRVAMVYRVSKDVLGEILIPMTLQTDIDCFLK